MLKIEFTPRWREELVATCDEGVLIFELTMGKNHVYFPNESTWITSVPHWAKDKWKTFFEECNTWCSRNGIPISIVDNALVYEERRK
jgi:hypothetical protein